MSLPATLAMWQVNDSLTSHDMHLLMIATIVIAIALAVQSLVIVIAIAVAGTAAGKAQKSAMAEIAEVKGKVMPLISKVEALTAQISSVAADVTPTIKNITTKVDVIAAHIEHISALAREKAEEFAPTLSAANETVYQANETVRDVNRKTQQQIDRVNGMVSSVLDATAQVGESIKRGIQIPGRELGGLASGIKAAFGVFAHRTKPLPPIEFHQPYRTLSSTYRSPDVLDEGIPGEPRQQ